MGNMLLYGPFRPERMRHNFDAYAKTKVYIRVEFVTY